MPETTNHAAGGPQGPLDAPRQSDAPRPLESLDAIPDETWTQVRDMLAPYREGFQKGWELEARRGNPAGYSVLPASRPDSHAAAHRLGFQDGIGWRMEVEAIVRKQLEDVIGLLDQEGVKSPLCTFDDPEYLPSRIQILLKERDPKACPAIKYVPPPKPQGAEGILLVDRTPAEAYAAAKRTQDLEARAAIHHVHSEDLTPISDAEKDDLVRRVEIKHIHRRYTQDDLARVLGIGIGRVKKWLLRKGRPSTKEDVARITAWLQRIS
ncbi:MAG: hypothetical protein Q8O14_00690 [bacterium]|nr:hypothetical protein [bacterium]